MLSTDASGKGASLVAAVVQKQKDELMSGKKSQQETKVEFTLMWKKGILILQTNKTNVFIEI